MKLACKQCQSPISKENANIQKGVCSCAKCGARFHIKELLGFHDSIARITQPDESAIQFSAQKNTIGFLLPPGGWTRGNTYSLIPLVLWNAISWLGFSVFLSRNEIGGILFMSVFVLIGLLFIVSFLFSLKGKVWVLANRARIKATWNLFGLEYNREGKTTDIVKVDIVTRYGENLRNQETLEVGVEFQDGGRIKFGAFLSKEERKWIVGELRAIIWQANRATDKL